MKTKKKTAKRKFGTFWVCPNCAGSPGFEHAEMIKHLSEVHGIDTKTTKGTRRMLMHVDGTDFFSSQHEWEIAGLKFIESTTCKRTGINAQMWGGA